MSLLKILGLKPTATLLKRSGNASSKAASPQADPGDDAATEDAAGAGVESGAPADKSGDAVVEQHDLIAQTIAGISDAKVRDGLDAELAALRATHAAGRSVTDAGKRATLTKAELAAAARLGEKVKKIAAQDQQRREFSDARADVDAVVSQITALVLGGITEDAPRKRIDDELTKLKLAVDKAGKTADPKAALTAFKAVLAAAETLLARAQGTQYAVDLSQANLVPLLAPTQAAIAGLPPAPKAVLQQELDSLKADIRRYDEAADSTALQSIVAPRLKKLNRVATGLPKASAQADADIERAARLVRALDPAGSAELQARLKALQDLKKTAWPGGSTLDAIDSSVDAVTIGAKTLIADAEALANKAVLDQQIAQLRAKLDALKPRIDKASESPVPAYIDQRQKNVRGLVAVLESQLTTSKKGPAETSLAALLLALDDTEKFKGLYAAHLVKLNAAKNGPIKTALALELVPPNLAASRDKAMAARATEIEAMTVDGVFGPADSGIDQWALEAKAWGSAKKAYDNLHSKKADAGTLSDLGDTKGGGPVLDALVADMPTDTTPPQVFITAMKARYGVEVEQFEHRKDGGKSEDPDEKTRLDPSKPDPDQEKDLQGLYKVLGKVPVKDVKYVEKINRYTKDLESATYSGGVFTDTIALHCGRPGDPTNTDFNKPGEVVPVGESVNPDCAPLKPGDTAPWFDFTVLHEVGHAVDDARNIMSGGRDKDAAWDTHGTGAVARKIGEQVHYDADYIESMLDDKASTPPKKKPALPKGWKQVDWDKARGAAEAWVQAIRVGKKLWDDAAGSKDHRIAGRVYHEAYDDTWVSYSYAARSQGITGYQFRAPAEWFAELYAAFHSGKLNPKHPAAPWLRKIKAESKTA